MGCNQSKKKVKSTKEKPWSPADVDLLKCELEYRITDNVLPQERVSARNVLFQAPSQDELDRCMEQRALWQYLLTQVQAEEAVGSIFQFKFANGSQSNQKTLGALNLQNLPLDQKERKIAKIALWDDGKWLRGIRFIDGEGKLIGKVGQFDKKYYITNVINKNYIKIDLNEWIVGVKGANISRQSPQIVNLQFVLLQILPEKKKEDEEQEGVVQDISAGSPNVTPTKEKTPGDLVSPSSKASTQMS